MLSYLKLQILSRFQDKLIFKPVKKNVEPLFEPSYYGLKNVEEINLVTEDNIRINIWHKPPLEGKPYFVAFHGNTGNFGDVGAPTAGQIYNRRYRIKFLQHVITEGAGIIAVSLRGYGRSEITQPSEAGFEKDINSVIKFIDDKHISYKNVIIFGESLGAANALKMLSLLEKQGKHPALLVSVAAFSSIIDKARELYPEIDEAELEDKIASKFDNKKLLQQLDTKTKILLFHPEKDDTTPKHHSEKLFEVAKAQGLNVEYFVLTDVGHINWHPGDVVEKTMEVYDADRNKKA
jgi:dipeptidyl aminopeptidase/acylaminoacyl peptidase